MSTLGYGWELWENYREPAPVWPTGEWVKRLTTGDFSHADVMHLLAERDRLTAELSGTKSTADLLESIDRVDVFHLTEHRVAQPGEGQPAVLEITFSSTSADGYLQVSVSLKIKDGASLDHKASLVKAGDRLLVDGFTYTPQPREQKELPDD